MTSDQKPLGSGLGPKPSAAQIMEGVDLLGKTAIVTGGYSGIGVETTKALVGAGANVIVPVRTPEKAAEALAPFGDKVTSAKMDLGDLKSVTAFASDVAANHSAIDLLVNNAGIMACPEARVGNDWESQFAINHLGHFVLTRALEKQVKKGRGRVVSLSSAAHKRSPIRFDDIHFKDSAYDKWEAYGQAKTANALFARGLNRRWRDYGIKAFSVHPGGIYTPLQRHLTQEEMMAMGWVDENGEIADGVKNLFKTPEQGATTSLWAATSPMLNDHGGQYCEDCDIAKLENDASVRFFGVASWACDDAAAAQLWDVTEKMLAA